MIDRLLEIFTKREIYSGLFILTLAVVATLVVSPYAIFYAIATAVVYANNL